jgi:carbon monoxide dehydrogenase subunit G
MAGHRHDSGDCEPAASAAETRLCPVEWQADVPVLYTGGQRARLGALAFAYRREVPMKVSGAGTLHAPAEVVWAALADRDVLVRVIPGIERLDVTGSGRLEFTITAAIAAVSGTYVGEAAVRTADPPSVLGLHISAAGARGTISADAVVRLAPAADAATEVGYEVDAEVRGPIAGIGQLMLVSIARCLLVRRPLRSRRTSRDSLQKSR